MELYHFLRQKSSLNEHITIQSYNLKTVWNCNLQSYKCSFKL
nr:MAG TPA: hypothetical protein [Caudoviricetes sp.]